MTAVGGLVRTASEYRRIPTFLLGEWTILPSPPQYPDPVTANIRVDDAAEQVNGAAALINTFSDYPGRTYPMTLAVGGRWTGWNGAELVSVSPSRTRLEFRARNSEADVWVASNVDWLAGRWRIEPDDQHAVPEHAEFRRHEDGSMHVYFEEYGMQHKDVTISATDGTVSTDNYTLVFVSSDRNSMLWRAQASGQTDARYTRIVEGAAEGTEAPPTAMETCLVCYCDVPLSQGWSCANPSGGHFSCDDCLESATRNAIGRSLGVVLGKAHMVVAPACEGHNDCPAISLKNLVSHVQEETADDIFRVKVHEGRQQAFQEVDTKVTQMLCGEGEGAVLVKDQVTKILHGFSVRGSVALVDGTFAAYQCRECSYGPILHAYCDLISAHQGHVLAPGQAAIDNRCPRCTWMGANIREWPRWDGTLPAEILPAQGPGGVAVAAAAMGAGGGGPNPLPNAGLRGGRP